VVAQCSTSCPTANIKLATHTQEGSPWHILQHSAQA
jgi:bacterioferritin-associated ferredoxin